MLGAYFDTSKYDLSQSFVIGDRVNDVKLAQNLGAKAIWLRANDQLGALENLAIDSTVIALETTDWKTVYEFLKLVRALPNIIVKPMKRIFLFS
jgi:imidazoleglycerol-phosphate dehydratase/histidinol-phosphatase